QCRDELGRALRIPSRCFSCRSRFQPKGAMMKSELVGVADSLATAGPRHLKPVSMNLHCPQGRRLIEPAAIEHSAFISLRARPPSCFRIGLELKKVHASFAKSASKSPPLGLGSAASSARSTGVMHGSSPAAREVAESPRTVQNIRWMNRTKHFLIPPSQC